MSTTAPPPEADVEFAGHADLPFVPRLVGVVAEFRQTAPLLDASRTVRDAGFTRWDTHTPFPLHGIDVAMGIKRTVLPWIILCCGLTGTAVAIGLQFWTNAYREGETAVGWPWSSYPYLISGKPYWSLPANIPIAFELTVLLSAFGAFFGMFALNRLYHFYNPLFALSRFRRVTDDRFFLSVDASDPKFDSARVRAMLADRGATAVDECWDDEPRTLPGGFGVIGLILFSLALVPPALIMRHRSVAWETPEYHPVQDMDFQPKFKSQQRNNFFADERELRPNPEGTVARGRFAGDSRLHLGIEPGQPLAFVQDAVAGEAVEATKPNATTPAATPKVAAAPPAALPGPPAAGMNENQNWTHEIPVPVTEKLMARGRQRFGIYCSPCHGMGGYGDGLVNERASSLNQPTWIKAPSLHTPITRNRPDGYIFRAITEGVRKMPSYGSQIGVEDRWAIVLYVRALQRSQGAAPQTADAPAAP